MPESKAKTRIATKKAIANFCVKFNLEESKITALLGKKYLDKLEKRGETIESYIIFKYKTIADSDSTSNDDIADFIKSLLDKKVNACILLCRNNDEYKGILAFLTMLPQIKQDILEKGETRLSKYPPINPAAIELLEKRYHETEEFWKRDEITTAMVLSPAIREFAKIGKMIHCYTQKDGDVLITTEKYNWDGREYRKTPKVEIKDISVEFVDSKEDKSNTGCTIAMFVAIFIAIGYYLSKIL